jgi:hypothetical protein
MFARALEKKVDSQANQRMSSNQSKKETKEWPNTNT